MRPSLKYKITFFVFLTFPQAHLSRKGFSAHSVIRAQLHRLIFRYKSQCSHYLRNVLDRTAHDRDLQLILSLTSLTGPNKILASVAGVMKI